jgi:hypothetical protein
MINDVKPAVVVPTEVRLIFSKTELIESAFILFAPDPYGHIDPLVCLHSRLLQELESCAYFRRQESRPVESGSPILFTSC